MRNKAKEYIFKDSPSIFWSWWHVIFTLCLVMLLTAIFLSVSKAHAASLPFGERIECRIEVENVFTGERRVTFKAYDDSKIIVTNQAPGIVLMIKVAGDEQVPAATIKTMSGELFAVQDKNVYRGICRNGKSIKVNP